MEIKLRVEMFNPDIQYIIAKEFTCFLCKEVLFDPQMDSCGHVFCKLCIHTYASKNRTCPIKIGKYYHQIDLNSLKPATSTLKFILRQDLCCIYSHNGCEWLGPLADLVAHQAECNFSEMSIKKRAKIASLQTKSMSYKEPCLFKALGCLSFLKKEEMNDHFNDNLCDHLVRFKGHFEGMIQTLWGMVDRVEKGIRDKLERAKIDLLYYSSQIQYEHTQIIGKPGSFLVFDRNTIDMKLVLYSPSLIRIKVGLVKLDYLKKKLFNLSRLIEKGKVTFFSTEGVSYENDNCFSFESNTFPTSKNKVIVYSEDSGENTVYFRVSDRVMLLNKNEISEYSVFLLFDSKGKVVLLNKSIS